MIRPEPGRGPAETRPWSCRNLGVVRAEPGRGSAGTRPWSDRNPGGTRPWSDRIVVGFLSDHGRILAGSRPDFSRFGARIQRDFGRNRTGFWLNRGRNHIAIRLDTMSGRFTAGFDRDSTEILANLARQWRGQWRPRFNRIPAESHRNLVGLRHRPDCGQFRSQFDRNLIESWSPVAVPLVATILPKSD